MFTRMIPSGLEAFRRIGLATPVVDLMIRLYVAKVFFMAGLTKIGSWDTTIALFENEYAVPLLPPELAAWMATAAELTLPVLLVLGLASRPAVLALFVLNVVAVISYPDISDAGIKDHVVWGLLMLVTFFHGPGALSGDHVLRKRFELQVGRGH